MNTHQIIQTTEMILQYFPHLNLADLKVFFDKMKMGRYGKNYDRVDGQFLLECLEEYNQDRMNEVEKNKIEEHKEVVKNQPIGSGYHPSVIEAMKNAIGGKKFTYESAITPRTPTEAELFYKRSIKQFDNLYRKYGKQVSVIRVLEFGSKIYTLDTFIERKINNIINSKY